MQEAPVFRWMGFPGDQYAPNSGGGPKETDFKALQTHVARQWRDVVLVDEALKTVAGRNSQYELAGDGEPHK
jgi:hypothetical protein